MPVPFSLKGKMINLVKFCNISKETRLGIKPGDFIVVAKSQADVLASQVDMGKNFVVLPLGQKLNEAPVKNAARNNKKSRRSSS